MKITKFKIKKEINGIKPFVQSELGDFVVLAGSNGSGKTRLIKLIYNAIKKHQTKSEAECVEVQIGDSDKVVENSVYEQLVLPINFSHYDAKLQSPSNFTPYVIHKAKDLLTNCNYEETALNSLLFLQDMVTGYSDEFSDGKKFEQFIKFSAENFDLNISKAGTHVKIFGIDIEHSNLSPGQIYLLRIAVACFQNIDNKNLIFFLDEPELHLHPKALIAVIKNLQNKFSTAQFWISTHSLALISYLMVEYSNTTVFHMVKGEINLLRSNSESLLEGLIGSTNNLFAIRQLLSLPDEYACIKFAVECFNSPSVISAKGNDPETDLVEENIDSDDVIIDFGAGKGRLLEELNDSGRDIKKIQYFAYDLNDQDSNTCKKIMKSYGYDEDNYYNDIEKLKSDLNQKADYILMINVLHEIEPNNWVEIFNNISSLLKEEGHLLIIERDELTIGESPYNNGFLVLTKDGATKLFKNNFTQIVHKNRKHIIKYDIPKNGLDSITKDDVIQCIEAIKHNAIVKIKHLKEKGCIENNFKKGISLAFWLNQYANATLVLDDAS